MKVYVAYDGTRFDDENECRAYEEMFGRYNDAVEKLPAALADIDLFCFLTRVKSTCDTCPIAELCKQKPSSFPSLTAYLNHIRWTDEWDNVYHNK